MSGKGKSEKVEEHAKLPKLDTENATEFWDTKKLPDTVWQQIFGFFSLKEIKLNVAKVCKHFYEISNDCVQNVVIDREIFASEHIFEMFDAIPTFKYLKTIKIRNDRDKNYTQSVNYFVIHVLKNCPRLRHLEILYHELSIGLIKQIAKYGQNLSALELDFENMEASHILSPLIMEMKNLKHLGLFDLKQYNYNAIKMLSNGKFRNMEVYGIIDSIVPILTCALVACPNLKFMIVHCTTDKRKDFPTNIIKVLFDNLTELDYIKFEWLGTNPPDNPIFIKSEMEEVFGNAKNQFKVEIGLGEFQEGIIVTRKSREM